MTIEDLRNYCLSLPGATEDIKWEKDLCFCIGEKIFCVASLDNTPTSASFKVSEDKFDEMSTRTGFKPAPYLARYKWVYTDDISNMARTDWEKYIKKSYEMVKSKLSKKVLKKIGLS